MKQGVGYVYKYIDKTDDIVKYVGLVNPGNSLTQRILQHEHEDWYHENFEVFYIEAKSKTDVEYLESAFIAHYKSYEFYNKAKHNWGISSLIDLDSIKWNDYSGFKDDRSNPPKKKRPLKKNNNNDKVVDWERSTVEMYSRVSCGSRKILKMVYRKLLRGRYESDNDGKEVKISLPLDLYKKIYDIKNDNEDEIVDKDDLYKTGLRYIIHGGGRNIWSESSYEFDERMVYIEFNIWDEVYDGFMNAFCKIIENCMEEYKYERTKK